MKTDYLTMFVLRQIKRVNALILLVCVWVGDGEKKWGKRGGKGRK
jgi:hypothetical protein